MYTCPCARLVLSQHSSHNISDVSIVIDMVSVIATKS